jgi:ribonucleoside-diphosphate reductase alpha chain
MMAAVQPFLSGAISKTVNLPSEATVEEVEQIYLEGWKLGLKAIALYRDGSKLSQPLTTKTDDGNGRKSEPAARDAHAAVAPTPPPLRRKRLPKRRYGFTQEARIAGHKVFIRTGEYDDGQLGEIFIDMHKEGAAFRSMMNCFAISVSMGLQYGVPLEDFVDQFVFTRFEPQGRVEGHDNLKACTSVIDYIFRVLGVEYLRRTDLAHIVDEKLEGQITTHVPSQQAWHDQHRGGNGGPGPIGDEVTRDANGGGAGPARVVPVTAATQERLREIRERVESAQGKPDALYAKFPGDAPMCDICGHITVRNGTCFKCLNCGNSLGCS